MNRFEHINLGRIVSRLIAPSPIAIPISDPTSKLILVQAAVDKAGEVWRVWSALVEQFG
jgi:hypothetical protein